MKIIKDIYKGYPYLFILPDDYATGAPMGFECFDSGISEQKSDGTINQLDALYLNGSSLQLAKDGKLNNVINPVTGEVVRYCVLGMQSNGWAVDPVISLEFSLYLATQYNIDKSLTIKSGLSAGGGATWGMAATDKTNFFKVYVPMSGAGMDGGSAGKVNGWKDFKGLVFAMHGDSDGICPISTSINYVNDINTANHGRAKLTTFKGVGHGPWSGWFDLAYTETFDKYTINWHQLPMVLKSNITFTFTAAGTTGTTGGTTPPPVSTTKAVPVVTIVKGTATLSANTSVLNGKDATSQAAFDWKITPGVAFATGDYGGADLGDRIATGFKANTAYVITLHVTDRYGGQNSATLNITTDANGSYGGTTTGTTTTATKKLIASVKIPGTPAVADKNVNTYLMPDGTYSTEVV
jgi:hypothetical protein